jgi:hypothetical protein
MSKRRTKQKPDTGYAILDCMIENDIPLTRKNYLELGHWGKPPKRVREGRNWEYELSLPPQFRMPFDDDYEVLEEMQEQIRARDHN